MTNGVIILSKQNITVSDCVVNDRVEAHVVAMKRKIKPFTKRFIKKIKYGI